MKSQPTVFIVDDDPAVLRSLEVLVRVVFPRVETFGSAGEFLADYAPNRPGCLVLDVAMPGTNGLELHRRMVEREIDLPVIFITGHANVRMAVGAIQAGAVDFLEKPFQEQDLWDAIRRAIALDAARRRDRVLSDVVAQRCSTLSPGEREVLDMILAGMYNKEMAVQLGISVRTVEDRRARMMKKMKAESVVELVQMMNGAEGGGARPT